MAAPQSGTHSWTQSTWVKWSWLLIVGLTVALRPPTRSASVGATAVRFARVQTIIQARCTGCHATKPTIAGFSAAPKGVLLDTPERIVAQRDAIKAQAVDTKAMPLGNVTGMTRAERDLVASWLAQGGRLTP